MSVSTSALLYHMRHGFHSTRFQHLFCPKGTHDRLKSCSFIELFTFCILYPFSKDIVIIHTFQ